MSVRSESEIMQLFMDFTRNDNRIRLVTLEGSRTNKNIPRDLFQGYDETITKYTQRLYHSLL